MREKEYFEISDKKEPSCKVSYPKFLYEKGVQSLLLGGYTGGNDRSVIKILQSDGLLNEDFEENIIPLIGESPGRISGNSLVAYHDVCPEVNLFDSNGFSAASGTASISGDWDECRTGEKFNSSKYRHYSECAEFCSIQFKSGEKSMNKEHPMDILFDEKGWDEYAESKIDKRIKQAEFYIDVIISEKLLNLDANTIRKYFKNWYKENIEFDLQIKNNDLAFEDGDLQMLPDLEQKNMTDFIKWFNSRKESFVTYMKDQGVSMPSDNEGRTINNTGNMIYNEKSVSKKQTINSNPDAKESGWNKVNVIVAIVVGIATIIGVIWTIVSS